MLIVLIGTIAVNVALYIKTPKGFLPMQDTGTLFGFARGDDAFSYEVMQPKIEASRKHIMAGAGRRARHWLRRRVFRDRQRAHDRAIEAAR
jgi:multidrug efflux pump subunit AcrB